MIAIGYIRRSKKSEARNVSLNEQAAQIRHYCEEHNLVCAEIVTHDGISGGKRSRFQAIENVRKHHQASALVIYDLDRLARDNAGLLEYLEDIMTGQGVELHETITGRMDYETAEGRLLLQIRSAFNEFLRMQTKRKTKHALQYIKATGRRYTRIAPFGYAWDGKLMVEEPEEQRALKIVSECQKLGLSVRKTMAHVRAKGYTGRLGRMTVYGLLTRPVPVSTVKSKLPAQYFSLPHSQ